MISKEIVVRNSSGLKANIAAVFIHKTSSYKSSVWIEKDDRKANAKSLLGLLSLGILTGETINLVVEGEDEEKACSELEEWLNRDLGENS